MKPLKLYQGGVYFFQPETSLNVPPNHHGDFPPHTLVHTLFGCFLTGEIHFGLTSFSPENNADQHPSSHEPSVQCEACVSSAPGSEGSLHRGTLMAGTSTNPVGKGETYLQNHQSFEVPKASFGAYDSQNTFWGNFW